MEDSSMEGLLGPLAVEKALPETLEEAEELARAAGATVISKEEDQ